MQNEIKIGYKVHYTSPHGSKENGIVKGMNDEGVLAWVVYHCNGDWDNYFNYTGASTHINDLTLGWIDNPNQ